MLSIEPSVTQEPWEGQELWCDTVPCGAPKCAVKCFEGTEFDKIAKEIFIRMITCQIGLIIHLHIKDMKVMMW